LALKKHLHYVDTMNCTFCQRKLLKALKLLKPQYTESINIQLICTNWV